MVPEKFRLNNGQFVPRLGLGTWQSQPGETKTAVLHALRSGYSHVDCAYVYGNENEVGQAIAQAIAEGEVRRQDLFITTKLWCTYHTRVAEALDKSLEALQLDYVDVYLMHWPGAMAVNGSHELFPKLADGKRDIDYARHHVATYQEMERVLASMPTKVIGIGVANYSKRYLEKLLPHISVKPAINQIENHPTLPQNDVIDYCREHGIHVTAYSPLGSNGSPLLVDPRIVAIAKKRAVGPGTVLLSYHVSQNR